MFFEVMDSLAKQLAIYKDKWNKREIPRKKIPVLASSRKNLRRNKLHTPELEFDYKNTKENLLAEYQRHNNDMAKFFPLFKNELDKIFIKEKNLDILPELWARIVYSVIFKIRNNENLSKDFLKTFGIVFMARFLTFYKEVISKTHEESEKEIIKQAELFRSFRHFAFERQN